jgi:hypothetical protein
VRAACSVAAVVVLVGVTPAAAVSQRRVTISVSGGGKAFWKLDAKSETARLALRYRWFGTIAFDVSTSGRLSATRAATLTAGWSGTYTDKVGGVLLTCTYGGAHVRSAVTAKLARGRKANTLELTFHPRRGPGFFAPGKSECEPAAGPNALPHFAPSSFFRDSLQDHGRMTTDTAILVLPAKLLPHGKATIAFPFERGRNDSVALGQLGWNNRGTTTLAVR